MLYQNDVVMIYRDPITRMQPEGKARLVRPANDQPLRKGELQYWMVEFEDDENDLYPRNVLDQPPYTYPPEGTDV